MTVRFEQCYATVKQSLIAGDPSYKWLSAGGLSPDLSTPALLECLRACYKIKFGSGMRAALIEYGLTLTKLQRALRLQDALLHTRMRKIQDELRNIGHMNFNVHEHPEWLLLELEANILIRSDQYEVAMATIAPASGSNSVLQMNASIAWSQLKRI
jgi:hypothetical protein